ncbi:MULTISPECIES: DUF4405 domain-containing protein [Pseudomonadota]|uniref:DUF4405 domain-containing protein n=1 Tax=Pseudomonadota TaxID=1224 RepID=UPI00093B641B|nr:MULTISPECIES: DUF4405 domain-containing protein [Pseudomonadota]MBX6317003.1 DUF4405 domain-containing protein [Pigmentiphaga sp.]
MNPIFLLRLVLDCIAAGLLLFAFAYFWQGNAAHELAGAGLFLLVVVHNAFHRRWFSGPSKGVRERRGTFNIALTLVLLAGMLGLLATSLVISETLFADLRLDDDFTVRRIHAGVAYWLLIVVAIHIGLRWPLLMAVARKLLHIEAANAVRTTVLRLLAVGIAAQGVCSALALNLRSRLLFQISLDWWNFEESAEGFFGHCMAVAGLCIFVTHYMMLWLRYRKRTNSPGSLATRRME